MPGLDMDTQKHVGLGTDNCLARFSEYQIIGRHLPSEANQNPKIYRMRVFAPNEVVAKSRFWYFLGKLRKIKKANGEIVSVNEVCTTPKRRSFVSTQEGCTKSLFRSTRSAPRRSRTSVSGSATTLAPVPTTCTRSTVRCLASPPSTLSTKIWLPVTDRVSGRSRYAPTDCTLHHSKSNTFSRSSRLSRSRSPRTSADHTSSSSSSRTSSSRCPTASTRRLARRSLPPSAPQLSSKRVSHYGVRSGSGKGCYGFSLGYAWLHETKERSYTLGTNENP